MKDVVVAVTGASGSPYALKILEELKKRNIRVHLVLSENGRKIMKHETSASDEKISSLAAHEYDNKDLSPSIASGSVPFHGMVIVPCSMNTLAKIASGIEDTLITRVAAVALKERRKLLLIPRETPLSDIHLDAMARLSRSGATIMPAMPGFYNKPKSIDDMVEFIAARILDHMDMEHDMGRWTGNMA